MDIEKTTCRELKLKSIMYSYAKSLKRIERLDCGECFKEKSFGVQSLEYKFRHWINPYPKSALNKSQNWTEFQCPYL